ncbi:hypothetical protein M3Y96_00888200 [Aphelenchoides besseyi]|nr:hypothetical protein M3Y96_00888200 [Aphelenchoides besseyi]
MLPRKNLSRGEKPNNQKTRKKTPKFQARSAATVSRDVEMTSTEVEPVNVPQPQTSVESNEKDLPPKLKVVKQRNLVASANGKNTTGFVPNWYTHTQRDPSFVSLSTNYPTEQSLENYFYHGEPEVERLNKFFGHFKRSDEVIRQEVETHKRIYDDLMLSQRLFNELSANDGRMQAMGFLADLIGWRKLPAELVRRSYNDDTKQAFETAEMDVSEIQRRILYHPVDYFDQYDIEQAPGLSILHGFQKTPYAAKTPSISCCIFTRHRNKRISRCLREPVKAFTARLCDKVAKKKFPYCWDYRIAVPAICAFHFNVIEKEPQITNNNPFFSRALGVHETVDYVRFEQNSQYEQLGRYINESIDVQKREHMERMNFSTRFERYFQPPKSMALMEDILTREFVNYDINGKTLEEINAEIERIAEARRKIHDILAGEQKTANARRSWTTVNESPTTSKLRQLASRGAWAPVHNSYIEENVAENLTEDERLLYKAIELGILPVHKTQAAEREDRLQNLLDIPGYDDLTCDMLRVYGPTENGQLEAPYLNFESLPAATLRRIKKFHKLPNRSGATSKAVLLDGLNDYFANKTVDENQIINEFMDGLKSRDFEDTDELKSKKLRMDKTAKRKTRELKKPNNDVSDIYANVMNDPSSMSRSLDSPLIGLSKSVATVSSLDTAT